jgi:hypothetical protein
MRDGVSARVPRWMVLLITGMEDEPDGPTLNIER